MIDTDNLELWITVAALGVEIGILILCNYRLRQPVNPAKPRLVPYSAIMVFLGLAILVTCAHTISVYTGQRLEAKNKMLRGSQP